MKTTLLLASAGAALTLTSVPAFAQTLAHPNLDPTTTVGGVRIGNLPVAAGNVDYTAPGTGTAALTAVQIFQQNIIARAYTGLDPTGTTDSSTAINNMLADAASTGIDAVTLPFGTYLAKASIILPSHVTLRGQCLTGLQSSSCTTLKLGATLSGPLVTSPDINSSLVNSITIGGTVTAGNTVSASFLSEAVNGGSAVTVTYTVKTGDTLASVAAGLAAAINANSTVTGATLSATSFGSVVTTSQTPLADPEFIVSVATSSGATETAATAFVSAPLDAGVGLENLKIDGNKSAGFTTPYLIALVAESSTFQNIDVENGSGTCMYVRTNTPNVYQAFTWLDKITGSTFANCGTYGLQFEGTDSVIQGNYFTANGVADVLDRSTGATRWIGNEIDNSAGFGLIRKPFFNFGLMQDQFVGNNFNSDKSGGISIQNPLSYSVTDQDVFVGETSGNHSGPDITIGSNLVGGTITTSSFGPPSGAYSSPVHISWGTGDTGWTLSGNSYDLGPASWFSNAPLDLSWTGGGVNGASNKLPNLTVGPDANGFGALNINTNNGAPTPTVNFQYQAATYFSMFRAPADGTFRFFNNQYGTTPLMFGYDGKSVVFPVLASAPGAAQSGSANYYTARSGTNCQLSSINSAGTVTAIGASFPCP